MYQRNNLSELLLKADYRKIDYRDKRIMLRSCLNVTTDEQGKMLDNSRYLEALPLIKELAQTAKSLVVMAHLGRPEQIEKRFSFWQVAEVMAQDLQTLQHDGRPVVCRLAKTLAETELTDDATNHYIYLLENIRFFPGEESKQEAEQLNFAKELAAHADVFINDAFPDYRESASTYQIAKYLPSFLGPAFYKEINSLGSLQNPIRPFVVVLGGAKLSEKLDALQSLLNLADKVLIGGAMAYTLLKAKGLSIGDSLFEPEKLAVAKEICEKYAAKLVLPLDHIINNEFAEPQLEKPEVTLDANIPALKRALDIGPRTQELFMQELSNAVTILINGPLGVTEWSKTEVGTREILSAILANKHAYKIAGGGDTIAAINKFNLSGFEHISTGGGAMLSFLAYEKFPTLDVILDKQED